MAERPTSSLNGSSPFLLDSRQEIAASGAHGQQTGEHSASATSTASASPLVTHLPPSWYSLDPIYHVPVKVFVQRLKELPLMPGSVGAYFASRFSTVIPSFAYDAHPFLMHADTLSLCGHPISMVEVVGTVTGLNSFYNRILVAIDDSTAVLPCCYWTNSSWVAVDRNRGTQNVLMNNKVKLGDLVRVRGKPHLLPPGHRPVMELNIYSVHLETDPNVEVLHWLDVMTLEREIYKKPFSLPAPLVAIRDKKAKLMDIVKLHLGFATALTSADLFKIRSKEETSCLPPACRPFSCSSLLEDPWIRECASHQVMSCKDESLQEALEAELEKVVKKLVAAGDVLCDPSGLLIQRTLAAIHESHLESYLPPLSLDDPDSNVASYFREAYSPSASKPYYVLSSELLTPHLYKIISDKHQQKVEAGKSEYGISSFECLKALSELLCPDPMPFLSIAHIQFALDTMVKLNLVFEAGNREYKPLSF